MMNKLVQIILLTFVSTACCAYLKVAIKYTFPRTLVRNNSKTVVVERDRDVVMGCIVDNKPTEKKVQWLVQAIGKNTRIPISADTVILSALKYRYQIDNPAANIWQLTIQNAQVSDQCLYICMVKLNGQQNVNDSRVIQVIHTTISEINNIGKI